MPIVPAPHRSPRSGKTAAEGPPRGGRVHRVNGVPNQALVDERAHRFRQPLEVPAPPLVVVNRTPRARSIHVLVIWDKWKNLPIVERGRDITDAFAAAWPEEQDVVRFTMGLTPGKALSQGYLRYQIVPLVRPADGVSAAAVKQAMNSAGGVRMQVGNDLQLRFATRGQAAEAYRRLVERINKPIWTLSEETWSSDAAD